MRLTPRTAKAAPWGRRACARGSRRRGRAGGGRGGAATSRTDRGAPPRDGQPPLGRALAPGLVRERLAQLKAAVPLASSSGPAVTMWSGELRAYAEVAALR